MAIADIEEDFMVFNGVGEDGVATYLEMSAFDHQKALKPWTKGSSDTDAGHGTFFLMSPVDPALKGKKMKYHVFCSPFDPAVATKASEEARSTLYPPAGKSDDDVFAALVHATALMSKFGKVWTKEIWAEKGEEGDYPVASIHEFRNPVFAAWKYEGEFYGFTLVEDAKTYHQTNKEHNKKLSKVPLKQRDRIVRMKAAPLTNDFQNVNVTGANITWFNRKAGFATFNSVEDVTVESLKGLIAAAEAEKR